MDKGKLIGRKMRGFEFQDGTDGVQWNEYKFNLINKEAIILADNNVRVKVKFENGNQMYYPKSLVALHLIDETTDETTEEKILAPEKGIIINVTESDGNVSYKLDSFNMTAIETLGLLNLITEQIKNKLNNQNPAL